VVKKTRQAAGTTTSGKAQPQHDIFTRQNQHDLERRNFQP
jgi:hypothetical protein